MEAPVPSGVPPQEPEYHFQEAPAPSVPPTSVKVTAPPHDGLGVAVILVGTTDLAEQVSVITTRCGQNAPLGQQVNVLAPPQLYEGKPVGQGKEANDEVQAVQEPQAHCELLGVAANGVPFICDPIDDAEQPAA